MIDIGEEVKGRLVCIIRYCFQTNETGKSQFLYTEDHWSQATLCLVSTWMGNSFSHRLSTAVNPRGAYGGCRNNPCPAQVWKMSSRVLVDMVGSPLPPVTLGSMNQKKKKQSWLWWSYENWYFSKVISVIADKRVLSECRGFSTWKHQFSYN